MSDYIKLGDMVRFGITISSPPSGQLINADETPRFSMYRNSNDVAVLQGNFAQRANLIGTYLGSGIVSAGNGFSTGDFVEIHASGKVSGVQNRIVIKDFVIDNVYKADIVSVSGININYTDIVPNPIYFAGIKFVHDGITLQDEYAVQWFKNSTPLSSGQVINAAISVYNTGNNNVYFENKKLDYFSVRHGGMRYNETTAGNILPSGEPALAVCSGTIDSATRVWTNPIGLDYFS